MWAVAGSSLLTAGCARRFLRKYNWLPIFALNIGIVLVWTIGQFGFGIFFSLQKLVHNVNSKLQ
jgi:hypothetical protein